MLISHKFQFVTIDIPTTGTRSYRQTLHIDNSYVDVMGVPSPLMLKPTDFYQHQKSVDAIQKFKILNWKWEDYFKYTTIRNPWARCVSYYMWTKTVHQRYIDKDLEKFLKKFKHIVYHIPKTDLDKYGPGWAWDDYNNYYQAERSEMPIYGNVIQAVKKSNGDIEITPDTYKIVFDFEQKKQLDRSEKENNFSLNPSLFKSGDTLYSPFITSRKNTISLLENALGKKVEFKKEELKDYNVLNSDQVDYIYAAILKDSDNLISESIAANISFRLNDTISVDKGVELIKSLSKQIELFDGSGLSRYNLVTPKSIISSLHDIYNLIGFDRIKKIFPKNYIIQDKEDFVWGKTGTLKNNHNYSGYIITDKNRIYIFSIMINHFTNDLSKIKDAIVDFLIYLKSNS